MQGLRSLARTDRDTRRRAELVLTEHAVEHCEHDRMNGERVERSRLGEERVHALRAPPFEVVAAARCARQDRLEVGSRRRDLLGLDGTRDRGVAVAAESGDDVLYHRLLPP